MLSNVEKVGVDGTKRYIQIGIGAAVGGIIKMVLGILGIVFFLILLYAGFEWITAAGDEKKVGQALSIIDRALIGLTIVIAAYAITVYVSNVVIGSIALPTPTP